MAELLLIDANSDTDRYDHAPSQLTDWCPAMSADGHPGKPTSAPLDGVPDQKR
jgi:hypothetical protein